MFATLKVAPVLEFQGQSGVGGHPAGIEDGILQLLGFVLDIIGTRQGEECEYKKGRE